MTIDKVVVLNALEKLGFNKISTCVGEAIEMDAFNAYLFANVTGASYLDNTIFPFSPKGTTKILREAFQYHFVVGIFEGSKLHYSPVTFNELQSYIFSGNKKILVLEIANEIEYKKLIKQISDTIIENNQLPTDYIVYRVEVSKNGNGMEPFLEYLACEHFKKNGYIVENQVPLAATVGSPDFGGYKLKNVDTGFHLIELSMIRLTKNIKLLDNLAIEYAIVGEAKTSTKIMASQLQKYLKTTLFKKGYEMHPDKKAPTFDFFGLMNISSEYKLACLEPVTNYSEKGDIVFDWKDYLDWFNNYIKLYLIANFTNEELEDFVLRKASSTRKYSLDKIISVIKETSILEISEEIRRLI